MSSRMSKYYEEPESLVTRSSRNEELYKDISKSELENYSIKSNATVLGDNNNDIDVDKIKKILDTRYNEQPKRKSIQIDEEPEEVFEREDTKEYDINAVLEKAKESKEINYEEERLKKLRDTQFDILNNLNVDEDGHSFEEVEEELPEEDQPISVTETSVKIERILEEKATKKNDDNLAELINTIALNESQLKGESDPLDILSDLKGDDDTKLLGQVKPTESDNEITEMNDIVNEQKTMTSKELAESFYTKSNQLSSKDFNDDEFKDIDEGTSIWIKILIIIIAIAFVAGAMILIKSIFFK